MKKQKVDLLVKQKKLELIERIKNEYIDKTGIENLNNRERKHVEHRSALINSMSRFSIEEPTAEALGRHRTTVYHCMKSHNVYYNYSALYRKCFSISESIVDKYAPELAAVSHTVLMRKDGRLRRGRKASQIISNDTSKSAIILSLQVKIDEHTKIIDQNIVIRASLIEELEQITNLDLIGAIVK
tara:strand:- start:3179 stop:3733 length:555 start_codon:yes stop_codon:yes gene_type:complete